MKLKTVTLRGYKSLAQLDNFELRQLNVLIGALILPTMLLNNIPLPITA